MRPPYVPPKTKVFSDKDITTAIKNNKKVWKELNVEILFIIS